MTSPSKRDEIEARWLKRKYEIEKELDAQEKVRIAKRQRLIAPPHKKDVRLLQDIMADYYKEKENREKKEQERMEKENREKKEQERMEKEKLEYEKKEQEEREKREKREQERIEKEEREKREKREQERIEKEKRENREHERIEEEKREKKKQERMEKEKQEKKQDWQQEPWNWLSDEKFTKVNAKNIKKVLGTDVKIGSETKNIIIRPLDLHERCIGFGARGIVYIRDHGPSQVLPPDEEIRKLTARKFVNLSRVDNVVSPKWKLLDQWSNGPPVNIGNEETFFSTKGLSISTFGRMFGEPYVNYFLERMLQFPQCKSLSPLFVPFDSKYVFVQSEVLLSTTCPNAGKETAANQDLRAKLENKTTNFLACYSMNAIDDRCKLFRIVQIMLDLYIDDLVSGTKDLKWLLSNIFRIFKAIVIAFDALHKFGITHNDAHAKNFGLDVWRDDEKPLQIAFNGQEVTFVKGEFYPILFDLSHSSITKTSWTEDELSVTPFVPVVMKRPGDSPPFAINDFCYFQSTGDLGRSYLYSRPNTNQLEKHINIQWGEALARAVPYFSFYTPTTDKEIEQITKADGKALPKEFKLQRQDVPSTPWFYPAKDLMSLPYNVLVICNHVDKTQVFSLDEKNKKFFTRLRQQAKHKMRYREIHGQHYNLENLVNFLIEKAKTNKRVVEEANIRMVDVQMAYKFILAHKIKQRLLEFVKQLVQPITAVYTHPEIEKYIQDDKRYVSLFIASLPFLTFRFDDPDLDDLTVEEKEKKKKEKTKLIQEIQKNMPSGQWDLFTSLRARVFIKSINHYLNQIEEDLFEYQPIYIPPPPSSSSSFSSSSSLPASPIPEHFHPSNLNFSSLPQIPSFEEYSDMKKRRKEKGKEIEKKIIPEKKQANDDDDEKNKALAKKRLEELKRQENEADMLANDTREEEIRKQIDIEYKTQLQKQVQERIQREDEAQKLREEHEAIEKAKLEAMLKDALDHQKIGDERRKKEEEAKKLEMEKQEKEKKELQAKKTAEEEQRYINAANRANAFKVKKGQERNEKILEITKQLIKDNPAKKDENGNYVYNAFGTNKIITEKQWAAQWNALATQTLLEQETGEKEKKRGEQDKARKEQAQKDGLETEKKQNEKKAQEVAEVFKKAQEAKEKKEQEEKQKRIVRRQNSHLISSLSSSNNILATPSVSQSHLSDSSSSSLSSSSSSSSSDDIPMFQSIQQKKAESDSDDSNL